LVLAKTLRRATDIFIEISVFLGSMQKKSEHNYKANTLIFSIEQMKLGKENQIIGK
jgi:hypothetical protein